MILCDTHCDTLFSLAMRPDKTDLDVTPQRLKDGGVSLQTMAMFVGGSADLRDIAHCFDEMKAAVPRLRNAGLPQVTSPLQAREGVTAFMLSIEGCDLLDGKTALIDTWAKSGVRMAALTWNYENCIGTPACIDQNARLKPFGREAARALQQSGIAVDTSHLSRRGFYDCLDLGLIPLASHSCCDALHACPRNLTDQQLKDLFSVGGYVGVNFCPGFLTDKKAHLSDVVAHILHMLELGGEGHIGFGSDFDGIRTKPKGLEHAGCFPALIRSLKEAGLKDDTIESIAGKALQAYYRRLGDQ